MVFLDVETTGHKYDEYEHHTFKLASTCYVRRRDREGFVTEKWSDWYSSGALCWYLEMLCRQKTSLYLFGHNVFIDLQGSGFFRHFKEQGWVLNFIYDSGLTYLLVIRKEKRTIKVISTTTYFQASVKDLGKMLDLPKLEVDFASVSSADLLTYCKRDVEIIKLAMEKYFSMIEENDLGRFSLTKASQAFTAFRHRFMKVKVSLHRHPEAVELERACYMGGRTEAFRLGSIKDGPFVLLDINSMYPFVMSTSSVPVRLTYMEDNPNPERVRRLLPHNAVQAEVDLTTDEPAYSIHHNGRICFPVGSFTAFLGTTGLKYALEHNHVKQIKRLAWYDRAIVFNDYVHFFYNLRKHYQAEKNPIFALMSKDLLNTLYGKFGQYKPIIEESEEIDGPDYERVEVIDLVKGVKLVEYKLLNKRFTEIGKEEGSNSFVAISAHITETARFMLWDFIKEVGRSRVLYTDTDSLWIRERDLPRLQHRIDPSLLGALKIAERSEKLIISGAKHYETDKGTKLKGVPKKAKRLDSRTYEYQQFLRQKEHLRKSVIEGFLIKTVTKRISGVYSKGVVTRSGLVQPFLLQSPSIPSLLPPPSS
ncbi:hypothetical protein ES703_32721 [subsurface metagenome]